MTASQLVPVVPGTIGNVQCLTVDGRTLHGVLGVRRDFSNWIKGRISKYGFIESQDFEVFAKTGENSEGGRPSQEYCLTVGMGKELCMVENNEQGRIARRYFIECERRLLSPEPVSIPDKLPAVSLSVTPSTVADRKPLRSLVNAWARVSGHPFDACWSQLKAAFSLTDIRDLPQEWIPDAVAWVQERIDKIGREPQTPGTMPALLPSTPGILSAELERYASKFERLAHSVEDMEQLLESVRRLSYPLTSEAARTLTGGHADGRGRLEAALEEHLDRSRRLAQELVPCARLGINIMRDLALGQGR